MIVSDNIYFADPSTFNDPLDTRPSLQIDLEAAELAAILRSFIEMRTQAEMSTAARTIKYRGPKTIEHIKRHSRRQADRQLEELKYLSTDPEYDDEAAHHLSLLGQYIESELLGQYDKGIFSLAERATCPLMWSHYGDQHKGVCIGYSVPPTEISHLHKVRYGGSRLVAASKISAMIQGDASARQEVDEAVLLRKAASWRYEREWRFIGPRGIQNSPLELEEIIFGMRCAASVKYAVAKALEERQRPVKLFELREVAGTFGLRKCALDDDDELFVHFPQRWREILDAFKSQDAEG
ncbi:MAG: DUF2971 domain-containing protein [Alphaproteobacteria bacterium]